MVPSALEVTDFQYLSPDAGAKPNLSSVKVAPLSVEIRKYPGVLGDTSLVKSELAVMEVLTKIPADGSSVQTEGAAKALQ